MFKYFWIGILLVLLTGWVTYAIADIIATIACSIRTHKHKDLEPITVCLLVATPVAAFIGSFLYWIFTI